jgi:hypothetical protein
MSKPSESKSPRGRRGAPALWLASALAFAAAAPIAAAQGLVTPPRDFFGFELGADRKIARWDRIVEYFGLLEKESDRVKVVDMGPTTEGRPFLLVIISAPANLSSLDLLRETNARISDPRGLAEAEVRGLIGRGRAVVCQSMSLHATEIGGTQMAPELAYDLASRADEETLRILDNVVFLMIPCFNPDGQVMVADWYAETLGTDFEGTSPPRLYHKYAGHDNNRDADSLNLAESAYAARILFRDWRPQAYLDHHHMGGYGARLYVPPYGEPIRPFADPLIWREHSWYGAHIAYRLEEAGKAGILNAAQYPGWGHFGWHWIAPFHNIAGMLTESASASLATPLYVHPDQLRAGARQFPAYEAQSTFPNPWPGGWWRLRDIVEQQKVAAWALLDIAARNRETVLWNAYLKAKRQTERGAGGRPAAFVVPAVQHDLPTALRMINTLRLSGIEVRRAGASFRAGDVLYPEGSFLVPLAQPKMGLVRNLLGRTLYADNAWTRDGDGAPLRPYDTATHTMAEFMGVRVDPVDGTAGGDFRALTGDVPPEGRIEGTGAVYALDGRQNAGFKAVNLLLDKGLAVGRIDRPAPAAGLRLGDFIVTGAPRAALEDAAARAGVVVRAVEAPARDGVHAVRRARVGLFQRFGGGNSDEGWTRLLLEQFAFPYATVMDSEVKRGGLGARLDVLILPHDSTGAITGEKPESYDGPPDVYPPEYRSGIGNEGVAALKAFVEKGGTLVALGRASQFAVEKLGLGVRDVTDRADPKEFFCPGSTLRASFDAAHPLAYGMPDEGLVLFWSGPAFEIVPGPHNDRCQTVARYAERDLLQSGWLVGEKRLSGKAAMVSAALGEGRVVLIGFRAQHRCQTHGTFKLLFNALLR